MSAEESGIATATRNDIVRLFPGIQDHTALEILDTHTSVRELEAAQQLLQDADEGLIRLNRQEGDQINRLLEILGKSEIRPADDDR